MQELSAHKRGVNLNYTLLNRYNGTDLICLFKDGLSLIINRLSFKSNKIKNDHWSLTALPFGLTLFFTDDEILICSAIL